MSAVKLRFTRSAVNWFLLKRAQETKAAGGVHPKKMGAHFHEHMKLQQLNQPGPNKIWCDQLLTQQNDDAARKSILAITYPHNP